MAIAETVLAFDAAGAACSAAVFRGGRVVSRRFEAMTRGHAEALVPMIQAVMAEAGLSYGDLDVIAVTVGPGGFTGVRIGLATARGLALAAARPLLGVTNFEAVAHAVPETARGGHDLLVVLDAKRAEVYAQRFPADATTGAPPMLAAPEALAAELARRPALLAGDAVDRVAPLVAAAGSEIRCAQAPGPTDAAQVAALAATRAVPSPDAPLPRPLYLRAPDVSRPKSGSARARG